MAFIPHYLSGSPCGAHQGDEHGMRNDWVVSVLLGTTAQFQYGAANNKMQTIELDNLAVLGMSRFLWHSVPTVKGSRWNITFRVWQHEETPKTQAPQRTETCVFCDCSYT